MGIFSFGKKKKPDPSKREPGYGVVAISPYLFDEGKFFDELREKLLPYLSEEEEEIIKEYMGEINRSFRALVPFDTFEKAELKDTEAFDVRPVHPLLNVEDHCRCGSWFKGCCGGIFATEHLQRADDHSFAYEKYEDELKDYFIIENIEHLREKESENYKKSVETMNTWGDL